MKPSEITLDMVRTAMKNTAAWAEAGGKQFMRVYAEDVVWYVHGYVPPVPDNFNDRNTRKRALVDADVFGKYNTGPTSSQTQAVRKLLTQLVDTNEVDRREEGNAYSYVYMSAAYKRHCAAHAELHGRMNALVEALRLERPNAGVNATIRKRANDEEYITVELGLSEYDALHVLACLQVGRE